MKVKINNIDEFCEALKAGKKIITEDEDFCIAFKDGVIRANEYENGLTYEPTYHFEMKYSFYEKPDPLKIECRKYYKMRNDKLACVCFYSRRFETDAFIGLMESGLEMSWSPDGKSTTNESDYDLVSEWKEDK